MLVPNIELLEFLDMGWPIGPGVIVGVGKGDISFIQELFERSFEEFCRQYDVDEIDIRPMLFPFFRGVIGCAVRIIYNEWFNIGPCVIKIQTLELKICDQHHDELVEIHLQ